MTIQAIRAQLWPGSTSVHDPILTKLSTCLGLEKARILLSHFQQTARGISCRYYNSIQKIGSKKYVHAAQRISPIIIGSIDDLSFYTVRDYPEDVDRESEKPVDMPFLAKYLLIPTRSGKMVFISDDHTHAAFAWHLAVKCKIIQKGFALFHIDEHFDNSGILDFQKEGFRSTLLAMENNLIKAAAAIIWETIEICSFIAFAADRYFGTLISPESIYFLSPAYIGKDLETRTSFFDSDNPAIASEIDGIKLSLERMRDKILVEKAMGKSVVLDIDLDFFRRFLPDAKSGIPGNTDQLEYALSKVIEAACLADFITIATSPNYLLVDNQEAQIRYLLNRIITALDT